MTYGWALLVVLIAIGALAFFGVLNPTRFLPTTCILGPGFACEDFKVEQQQLLSFKYAKIQMNIRNGMGKNFDTFIVYIDKDDSTCPGFTGYVTHPSSAWLFSDGEVRSLNNFFPGPPDKGIACLGEVPANTENCCNYDLLEIDGKKICDLSGACNTWKPVNKGEKFSTDLVIVYREKGKSILHSRVGKLTAQVE